ncbi:MAG: hypothetical protein Q7K16_01105 [Candidatus Azambacteria bacterium]|nr:hypothetical protein [Candidatus Azambacteria bacterium]
MKYDPPMASVASSFGTCFSNILLDAVCYLTEYNTTPCIVKVIMKGPFFQRHIEQAKKIFDLYKKAERVFVEFETYDYSD